MSSDFNSSEDDDNFDVEAAPEVNNESFNDNDLTLDDGWKEDNSAWENTDDNTWEEDDSAWQPEQKQDDWVEDDSAWQTENKNNEALEDDSAWQLEQKQAEWIEDDSAWQPENPQDEWIEDDSAWATRGEEVNEDTSLQQESIEQDIPNLADGEVELSTNVTNVPEEGTGQQTELNTEDYLESEQAAFASDQQNAVTAQEMQNPAGETATVEDSAAANNLKSETELANSLSPDKGSEDIAAITTDGSEGAEATPGNETILIEQGETTSAETASKIDLSAQTDTATGPEFGTDLNEAAQPEANSDFKEDTSLSPEDEKPTESAPNPDTSEVFAPGVESTNSEITEQQTTTPTSEENLEPVAGPNELDNVPGNSETTSYSDFPGGQISDSPTPLTSNENEVTPEQAAYEPAEVSHRLTDFAQEQPSRAEDTENLSLSDETNVEVNQEQASLEKAVMGETFTGFAEEDRAKASDEYLLEQQESEVVKPASDYSNPYSFQDRQGRDVTLQTQQATFFEDLKEQEAKLEGHSESFVYDRAYIDGKEVGRLNGNMEIDRDLSQAFINEDYLPEISRRFKINDLTVDPLAQGNGTGSALLDRAEYNAHLGGAQEIYGVFSPETGREADLERFYTGKGFSFREVGQHREIYKTLQTDIEQNLSNKIEEKKEIIDDKGDDNPSPGGSPPQLMNPKNKLPPDNGGEGSETVNPALNEYFEKIARNEKVEEWKRLNDLDKEIKEHFAKAHHQEQITSQGVPENYQTFKIQPQGGDFISPGVAVFSAVIAGYRAKDVIKNSVTKFFREKRNK